MQSSLLSVCFVRILLPIYVIAMNLAIAGSEEVQNVEDSKRQETSANMEIKKVFEALANRNRPPKIDWSASNKGVLFPKDYDWKEQDRVVNAIANLLSQSSPEFWDQLLVYTTDPRYCFTFYDEHESSGNSGTNWTVGRLCTEIACFQLTFPVRQATVPLQLNREGRPVFLPLKNHGWPEANQLNLKPATFVERQIGLCRDAIEDLPRVNNLNGIEKVDAAVINKCKDDLEAMIVKLKESRVGVFGKFSFPGKRFRLYHAEGEPGVRASGGQKIANDLKLDEQKGSLNDDRSYMDSRKEADELQRKKLEELEAEQTGRFKKESPK